MGKIIDEYVSTFTAWQSFIVERLKAHRKKVQIKRARVQARLMSEKHGGKKYYIVYDCFGRLRILCRDEIIILQRRGEYNGKIDHISLNRDSVGFEQVNPNRLI